MAVSRQVNTRENSSCLRKAMAIPGKPTGMRRWACSSIESGTCVLARRSYCLYTYTKACRRRGRRCGGGPVVLSGCSSFCLQVAEAYGIRPSEARVENSGSSRLITTTYVIPDASCPMTLRSIDAWFRHVSVECPSHSTPFSIRWISREFFS